MSAPRKYSDAIKEAVIARYMRRIEKVKQIAASLEIPYWTCVSWIKDYNNDRKSRQGNER